MTISSLLIICIVGLGCLLCCYLLKEKIALGKENQHTQTHTKMHSAKPLLKSYTKAGKIYVLRNKPAEFPSHAIQYFYNHVLVCVWRFGHSAASLLGSRLRWKPNKVGQPRVRASPAVSKSKSQPGNKAPACIV